MLLSFRVSSAATQSHPDRWSDAIDAYWGAGSPIEEQLAAFDAFWTRADTAYAAFVSVSADWDELRARYRTEVDAGVSRGRFASILNHLALALRESHTFALDSLVNVRTDLSPGVPLLHGSVWGDNGHFGACLAPLPDRSLLVYAAVEEHPLNLEPGDIVLGYDGRPWSGLYPELLAAEIPVYYRSTSRGGAPPDWSRSLWGAAPSAWEHGWLRAAGLNWHLFSTLDVLRRQSGSTERIDVNSLVGANLAIRCTDQLPVPGVPFPAPAWSQGVPRREAGEYVSWGVVEGTQVGYIYVWSWYWGEVQEDFQNAVERFVGDPTVDGLIVDFRFNHGGFPSLADDGLALLFDKTIETLELLERDDPDDRFALVPSPPYAGPLEVRGEPSTSFDRPIAMLIGPGAYSAGDFNALRLRYHPRVRTFGKSTAAAFTPAWGMALPGGFWGAVAFANAQRVDTPGVLLIHSEQVPDEEVWLEATDAAAGEDTVVRRALAWIEGMTTNSERPSPFWSFSVSPAAPNPTSATFTVWIDVPEGGRTRGALYDLIGREVAVVSDEFLPMGRHRLVLSTDGLASGAYVLRVTSGNAFASQQVTIVR